MSAMQLAVCSKACASTIQLLTMIDVERPLPAAVDNHNSLSTILNAGQSEHVNKGLSINISMTTWLGLMHTNCMHTS